MFNELLIFYCLNYLSLQVYLNFEFWIYTQVDCHLQVIAVIEYRKLQTHAVSSPGTGEQLHRVLAEVLFSMLLPVAVKFSRELLTLCAASLARCFSCCFISSCYCFCHWPKVPWLPCGRLGVDFFCCSMMCVVHVEKVVGMWGWRWRSFLPCPYTKTDCRRMSESNESQNLGSVSWMLFLGCMCFPEMWK